MSATFPWWRWPLLAILAGLIPGCIAASQTAWLSGDISTNRPMWIALHPTYVSLWFYDRVGIR